MDSSHSNNHTKQAHKNVWLINSHYKMKNKVVPKIQWEDGDYYDYLKLLIQVYLQ